MSATNENAAGPSGEVPTQIIPFDDSGSGFTDDQVSNVKTTIQNILKAIKTPGLCAFEDGLKSLAGFLVQAYDCCMDFQEPELTNYFTQLHLEQKMNPPNNNLGQPRFSLQGDAAGNNLNNFHAGFDAGVSAKVWENKTGSAQLDLGASYGQSFVRHQGQTFKSKPNVGATAGLTFRF